MNSTADKVTRVAIPKCSLTSMVCLLDQSDWTRGNALIWDLSAILGFHW
jgi:hypothetical protein